MPSTPSRALTRCACSRPSGESGGSPCPSVSGKNLPATYASDSPCRTSMSSIALGGGRNLRCRYVPGPGYESCGSVTSSVAYFLTATGGDLRRDLQAQRGRETDPAVLRHDAERFDLGWPRHRDRPPGRPMHGYPLGCLAVPIPGRRNGPANQPRAAAAVAGSACTTTSPAVSPAQPSTTPSSSAST